MRTFFSRLLASFGVLSFGGKPTMTALQFRDTFIKTLQKLKPGIRCTPHDEMRIDLELGDKKHNAFLGNAYTAYCHAPASGKHTLEHFARACLESFAMPEVSYSKDAILPVIKDKAYYRNMCEGLAAKGFDATKVNPFHISLNDIFDIFFVEDTPRNMRFINATDLEKFGVTSETILAVARENLGKQEDKIQVLGTDGVFMLRIDGTYEASCILLPDLMRKVAKLVDGQLVAIVPSRDIVFLTGSNDAANIEKAKVMADEVCANAPYGLASAWMTYSDGNWVKRNP